MASRKKMRTARKPIPQKGARPTSSREALLERAKELLWTTEFDDRLLRVLPSPLSKNTYELTFDLEPHEYGFAAFWEYRREIRHEYDILRSLQQDDYSPTSGGMEYFQQNQRWKAEHVATCIEIWDLFPLPISEIRKAGFLKIHKAPKIKAFSELTSNDSRFFQQSPPPAGCSIHSFLLDWEEGASEIKNQFIKWLEQEKKQRAEKEKHPADKRGSVKRLLLERRLNQLGAWRAHRLGLRHGQFEELYPGSWADPSSFRNGYKKAESVLLDLLTQEGWLLFSGR